MARVVKFNDFGGPDALYLAEEEIGSPGPGEVRLAIEAFGLNRAEVFYRHGWHPFKPPAFPSRIGYETAGHVEAVGPGVDGFAVGDRVSTAPIIEINALGGYAEAVVVPARFLIPSPPELSAVETAALWCSYLTAYGALVELVKIEPGDIVLCTAASSGVGTAAIQMLNMMGAKPVAVTTSRAKATAIRALGAHDVIVAEDEDLVARVMAMTNGVGARVIFDPIGGPGFAQLAEAAAYRGTIISYGLTSPEPTPLPMIPLISKNLSVLGYAMMYGENPGRNERGIAYIRDGVARGRLRPVVGRVFPFDEVVEACRYHDSMQQIGKTVVQVG